MAKNFWILVNRLIREADIILEVLDARLIKETRNEEIEKKVEKAQKKILYVISKCDLVEQEFLEKVKKQLKPSIFVSAKKHYGTTMLLQKIAELGKGKEVTVGVLGYPNVGKSSVINALKGRKSASVSSIAGHTKGLQKIRISKNILLIDSPGVLSFKETDEVGLSLIGAKDVNKVKDPEAVALQLIELFQEQGKLDNIAKAYAIQIQETDSFEILEEIALKKKRVKKANTPDTKMMATIMIRDWQGGKLVW